jgi:hypothetical protein
LKVDYMGWAGSGQSIRAAPWRPKREREMAQTAGRPGPAASLRFIFSAVEANTGLRDAPPPSPSLTTTHDASNSIDGRRTSRRTVVAWYIPTPKRAKARAMPK